MAKTLPWCAVLVLLGALDASASSGGITGYSGQVSGVTCSNCHAVTSGTTPTAAITGPATLAPGATGSYRFTLSGGPGVRGGFNVSVDNVLATLAGVSGQTTAIGGEVTQSAAKTFTSGAVSFDFTLTAPASATTLHLYGAGNSCNGSGTAGDREALATFTITVGSTNAAPTVATAAAAASSTVNGTSVALSVLGADDGGEAALTYTWSSSGPAAVTFSANGSNAAKATTATFTRAGSYTFTATLKDAQGATVTSAVTVTVAQSVAQVAVTPGSATVLASQSQPFAASAVDQFAQPLSPAPTFTWGVTGGGTVSSTGVFTAGATAGGPFTVSASAGGKSGTAQVSVSAGNQAPTIATAAAASPATVSGASTALSVLGADDSGEAGLTYTWATTAGPALASFGASGTNAAKSTTATFTKAGSYTLEVTLRDAAGLSVKSAVSVTVAQTLSALTVAPATASVPGGGTQAFGASGVDQFGQPMAALPALTWSTSGGGTITSAGVFTAGASPGGPFTVTASAAGKSGTAQLTVAGGAPTFTTAAAATPSPVTGTSAGLSALASDDGGEAALTYTWALTAGPAPVTFSVNGSNAAKATSATFTRAGSYAFSVTAKDAVGLTAVSTVNLVVSQTVSAVQVTPATTTVNAGASQAFTATASDQFAQTMSPAPALTWSVSGGGAVSSTGVFTAAGTPGGPFTATAAAGPHSGTAQVTVSNGSAPSIATAASASPATVTQTTAALTVLGADDGGEAALTYTWVMLSGPSAAFFAPNGTNAAKASTATFTRAGDYVLQVTAKDATGQATSSAVTVTVAQTTTTVSVTPPTASVRTGAALQLAARASDQFGVPLASAPTFTWSASGGGTVSSTGLFTAAETAGGPYVVTALAQGKSGTASVSVTAVPGSAPVIVQPARSADSVISGTSAALSVLASDDGGDAQLSYTWSSVSGPAPVAFSPNATSAAKSSTAAFTRAGSYLLSVTVKDASGLTTSSDVTVNVASALGALEVIPGAVTVAAGASTQFAVAAKDQFDQPLLPAPAVAWSVSGGGTVTSAGLFRAGSASGGPFTLTATTGSRSATSAVTVGSGVAPVVAAAASAMPQTVLGRSTTLRTLAQDDAPETTLTYRWRAMGPGAVAFLTNDANAAKQTVATFERSGAYTLTVTVVDGQGLQAESAVSVQVDAVLTAVEVTPAVVTVSALGQQPFTATPLDQFGLAIPGTMAMAWQVNGGGTIDAAGTFTARAQGGGPFVVSAAAQGIRGAAQVTVEGGTAPDVTAPSVSLESVELRDGALLVSALASDDVGVTGVTFFLDGAPAAALTQAPWSATLDVAALGEGPRQLVVEARDAAGHVSRSAEHAFELAAAPGSQLVVGQGPFGCSASGPSGAGAPLLLLAMLLVWAAGRRLEARVVQVHRHSTPPGSAFSSGQPRGTGSSHARHS
ncbi:MAG: PKD domain-containing protein [Myxococcaceae bacterium]|nr:PKD domain-containing protein [Myxococcaceae bacterium]